MAQKKSPRKTKKQARQKVSTLIKAKKLFARGHLESALPLFETLLEQQPNDPDLLYHTGYLYYAFQQYNAAAETLQKLITLMPKHEEGRRMLLASLNDGKSTDAMLTMARSIKENPLNDSEYLQAFSAFLSVCDWNNALPMLNRCIDSILNNNIPFALLPGFLMNALGLDNISCDTMYALTKKAGELSTHNVKHPTLKKEQTHINNKIKLAYLSSDLRTHPVGYFIYSILAAHDKDRFEIFCYSGSTTQDKITTLVQKESDHFLDISQLNETEIVQRIQNDGIHILIELGGYTASSRLKIMAYHPAPVCIAYLGYPNSTGYTSIDFRITDPYVDTADGTKYSETLLTLPKSFICFGMRPTCTRSEHPPFNNNGYITFGSFNHRRKLNPQVIKTWSKILKHVENSRLMLKGNWLLETVGKNILNTFKSNGINADRITFLPYKATYDEHVACYNEIDIALDTFPYTGTTTTCEALWMGVPVVTLAGKSHQSRVSYSILKNIGFEETITHSEDEYIDKAVKMAGNTGGLNLLRPMLHTLFLYSPVAQPQTITAQIEELYIKACNRKGMNTNSLTSTNQTINSISLERLGNKLSHTSDTLPPPHSTVTLKAHN